MTRNPSVEHETGETGSASAAVDLRDARRPSNRRRALFVGIYLLFLVLLGWVGMKAVLQLTYGVPVTRRALPQDVLRHYYQALKRSKLLETAVTYDDEFFDVLLLGGSVLEQVAVPLEKRLQADRPQPVRVFNVAESAHTTRDSLLKYKYLTEKQFDAIVIYHGINDARMNCCRPGEFRDDYSHCHWYRGLETRLQTGRLWQAGLAADLASDLIPLGEPTDESFLDYGDDLKTPGPFRQNLEWIVRRAAESPRTQVVLMTFAWHLPEEYTRERFLAGELDYAAGSYALPVEIWGRADNVRRAIEAHNRVLRELANDFPQVLFIDLERDVRSQGRYFSDVCHLSPAGVEVFIDRLHSALAAARDRTGTPSSKAVSSPSYTD